MRSDGASKDTLKNLLDVMQKFECGDHGFIDRAIFEPRTFASYAFCSPHLEIEETEAGS
jgi:hypothetical protein